MGQLPMKLEPLRPENLGTSSLVLVFEIWRKFAYLQKIKIAYTFFIG